MVSLLSPISIQEGNDSQYVANGQIHIILDYKGPLYEFPLKYPKVISSLAGCGLDEACSISAFTFKFQIFWVV